MDTGPKPINECRTVSVAQAGKRLGICRNTAYKLVGTGDIPAIRVGHRWLVPVSALERMLNP